MNKEQIKVEQTIYSSRIQSYQDRIAYLTKELEDAQYFLDFSKGNICFFQFETHEEAKEILKESLHNKAHKDCENPYNCGEPEYKQQYQLIDSDVVYLGKIKVQYKVDYKRYSKIYSVDKDMPIEYSFSEVK